MHYRGQSCFNHIERSFSERFEKTSFVAKLEAINTEVMQQRSKWRMGSVEAISGTMVVKAAKSDATSVVIRVWCFGISTVGTL